MKGITVAPITTSVPVTAKENCSIGGCEESLQEELPLVTTAAYGVWSVFILTHAANANPSGKPLGCIEWEKCYRQNSTDPWGYWDTASGGDNTAVLNTDTPGFYKYRARNGSDDSWKISSVVTVIRAKIIFDPEYLLVYTGNHAADTPTRNVIARGEPKGGTFDWSCEKSGTGDIEFVGFTDGPPSAPSSIQTAEIKGTQPSLPKKDVKLKVTYELDGKECEDSISLTVRRMKYTSSYAGVLTPLGEGPARWRRYYYHPIFDQFDDYIDEAGIPCDEIVTWKKGSKGWQKTGPSPTAYHTQDGSFPGGNVVRDTLECSATRTWAEYHQHLKAGGWDTSPNYYIYLDPIGTPDLKLWKEQTTDE